MDEPKSDQLSRDKRQTQFLKGLAELALMKVLKDGPEYGLRILELIRTEAGLDIAEETLYPLLYWLEKSGFVQAEWCL